MAYAIGVDFGTLSARAVLVDLSDGKVLSESVREYPHGAMQTELPDGKPLGTDWALASPKDYADALMETIAEAVRISCVAPEEVIGIGVDATASTFLPVKNGTPLCADEGYVSEPHAWMKLWKHHGATEHAARFTRIAEERKEAFLPRCGGKINAEWMLPKLLEIYEDAPQVVSAADSFMEVGDWLVYLLTGQETRNTCAAGYKLLCKEQLTDAYFDSVSQGFSGLIRNKLRGREVANGSSVGTLLPEVAKRLGLCSFTVVAAANVDAHVSAPGAGIDEPGKLLMILGTSCCAILCATEEHSVPGVFGMVRDGILPGYVGYEAGQSCVGDLYNWYVNSLPSEWTHESFTKAAETLRPGESGLLALDWFNGNRSCLADARLSGMMIGMTLQTKPPEIYRALIEATAYGMRKIIETFEASGVRVDMLYASGGIARKNSMLMQIYADVTGREIRVASSDQTSALGSALHGAVAAGVFKDVMEAARKLGHTEEKTYVPNGASRHIYDRLYKEYDRLHDYFGRGENNVMKVLRDIKDGE